MFCCIDEHRHEEVSEVLCKEGYDMPTIRHPMGRVLPLVGMGLMLAGLFGDPALPTAAAADVAPFVYQHDGGDQHQWGPQDPWGDRHDRLRRQELGYGLPARDTI
jgi:hypothetical protein